MTRIKFTKLRKSSDIIASFLIAGFTRIKKETGEFPQWHIAQPKDGKIDIQIMVNGHEIPVDVMAEVLTRGKDELLKRAVSDIIKEKFSTLESIIYTAQEDIIRALERSVESMDLKLNIRELLTEEDIELLEKPNDGKT